jgi:hypothetical protein
LGVITWQKKCLQLKVWKQAPIILQQLNRVV